MDPDLKKYLDDNFTKINTQFNEINKKLDQIFELVTANGQGIETISSRLDKVEIRIIPAS